MKSICTKDDFKELRKCKECCYERNDKFAGVVYDCLAERLTQKEKSRKLIEYIIKIFNCK